MTLMETAAGRRTLMAIEEFGIENEE